MLLRMIWADGIFLLPYHMIFNQVKEFIFHSANSGAVHLNPLYIHRTPNSCGNSHVISISNLLQWFSLSCLGGVLAINIVPDSFNLGCWCHLVKWFDWSMVEPNLVQRWDKPSSRWKGSAFWDLKRDKVKQEDRKRLLFCVLICLSAVSWFYLVNKWKSLTNV